MVKPYRSRRSWRRHGIPITIALDYERGNWHGEVYLDIPEKQIPFPCYALFLDPANAIIVQSKHFEPFKDSQDIRGTQKLVPRNIFCTHDLHPSRRKTPEGGTYDASPVDGTGNCSLINLLQRHGAMTSTRSGPCRILSKTVLLICPSGSDSETPTYPSLEHCSDDYPLPPFTLWAGDCGFNLSGKAIESRDKMVHNR